MMGVVPAVAGVIGVVVSVAEPDVVLALGSENTIDFINLQAYTHMSRLRI